MSALFSASLVLFRLLPTSVVVLDLSPQADFVTVVARSVPLRFLELRDLPSVDTLAVDFLPVSLYTMH